MEISKNDKIEIAKQSVIDKNLGHLYRFENDICFDCKKKVTDDVDAGYAQFFSILLIALELKIVVFIKNAQFVQLKMMKK